jgi:dipeptidase
MCDTMAASGAATTTGFTLFAKNSDRERNEAQYLELLPAQHYGRGAVVRCTYVAIPQVARTHAVLLSRPFWIWGAEMGANEHGVVIGNEAVHPRLLPQRRETLIGMDLLRLGLERGATAAEAVSVITGLLEQFGQGGSCGHMAKRYYDNSFIVADRSEVYVVETIGRRWAVERAGPTRAISNTYTIGTGATAASPDLEAFARAQGWWTGNAPFDFAAAVTNTENPGLPGARGRCARATELLARQSGRVDAAAMMANLRDHGGAAEGRTDFHPQQIESATICMHAGDGTRRGQSVAAMVSDLREGGAVHWVTGTSAPCTSVFKPVFIDAGLPDQGARPGDRSDPATLWWRHEQLHRAMVQGDYAAAMTWFRPERDALEAEFRTRVEQALALPGDAGIKARREVAEACWRDAAAAEATWIARAGTLSCSAIRPPYKRAWSRFDKLAAD